jgi:hypothetical protein
MVFDVLKVADDDPLPASTGSYNTDKEPEGL